MQAFDKNNTALFSPEFLKGQADEDMKRLHELLNEKNVDHVRVFKTNDNLKLPKSFNKRKK